MLCAFNPPTLLFRSIDGEACLCSDASVDALGNCNVWQSQKLVQMTQEWNQVSMATDVYTVYVDWISIVWTVLRSRCFRLVCNKTFLMSFFPSHFLNQCWINCGIIQHKTMAQVIRLPGNLVKVGSKMPDSYQLPCDVMWWTFNLLLVSLTLAVATANFLNVIRTLLTIYFPIIAVILVPYTSTASIEFRFSTISSVPGMQIPFYCTLSGKW